MISCPSTNRVISARSKAPDERNDAATTTARGRRRWRRRLTDGVDAFERLALQDEPEPLTGVEDGGSARVARPQAAGVGRRRRRGAAFGRRRRFAAQLLLLLLVLLVAAALAGGRRRRLGLALFGRRRRRRRRHGRRQRRQFGLQRQVGHGAGRQARGQR